MFTVLILGVLLTLAGVLILDSLKARKRNVVAAVLIGMGIVVAVVGTFTSGLISDTRTATRYINCTPENIPIHRDCILSDGTSFFRPKDCPLGREFWVPGALVELEPCDPPKKDFCVDCMSIQTSTFCERCGKQLVNLCPNCGNKCDDSYCGKCGSEAVKGQ